jgi:hypothetical protein
MIIYVSFMTILSCYFQEGDVKKFQYLIEDYDNSYWSRSASKLGY